MRLPTRGLRFAAVALLVGINLAQFSGRIFAGTEPPLDEVAADIWRHDTGRDIDGQPHNPQADPSALVFVNDSAVGSPGHPGYGTLNGQAGKYYLGLARRQWFHPTKWKRIDSSQEFTIHFLASGGGGPGRGGGPGGGTSSGGSYAASSIVAMVNRSPAVKRVIVWDKFFDTVPDAGRRIRWSGCSGRGGGGRACGTTPCGSTGRGRSCTCIGGRNTCAMRTHRNRRSLLGRGPVR